MRTASVFHDPADNLIGGDMREELNGDSYEDERQEDMVARIEREAYIEAAHKLIPIIVGMLNYIRDSGSTADVSFRLAVACHYFGHPAYAGKSMSEICESFGKTRAAGSYATLQFQRRTCRLPELIGQKSQETRATYYNKTKENIRCKTNLAQH